MPLLIYIKAGNTFFREVFSSEFFVFVHPFLFPPVLLFLFAYNTFFCSFSISDYFDHPPKILGVCIVPTITSNRHDERKLFRKKYGSNQTRQQFTVEFKFSNRAYSVRWVYGPFAQMNRPAGFFEIKVD